MSFTLKQASAEEVVLLYAMEQTPDVLVGIGAMLESASVEAATPMKRSPRKMKSVPADIPVSVPEPDPVIEPKKEEEQPPLPEKQETKTTVTEIVGDTQETQKKKETDSVPVRSEEKRVKKTKIQKILTRKQELEQELYEINKKIVALLEGIDSIRNGQ